MEYFSFGGFINISASLNKNSNFSGLASVTLLQRDFLAGVAKEFWKLTFWIKIIKM
jgi:hypothetical protein